MGLLCSLPLLVVELGIQRFFEQEIHIGSPELSSFNSPAKAPDTFVFKRSCVGGGLEGT
jgi:hypothetical protein